MIKKSRKKELYRILLNGIILQTIIFLVSTTLNYLYLKSHSSSGSNSNIDNAFILVFIVPIIETFIFQYLILELPFWFKNVVYKKDKIIFILFSSVAFSLTHNYTDIYLILTFTIGCYFGSFYYYIKSRKLNAFGIIYVMHAWNNILAFVIKQLNI